MDVRPGTDVVQPGTDVPVGAADVVLVTPTGDNPCAPSAIIEASGPGSDGIVHVLGNTEMMPMHSANEIPTPAGCIAQGADLQAAYQVAVHYRMRGTANVRFSTVNPGTVGVAGRRDGHFDTVIDVRSGMCSASGMSIDCNDDDAAGKEAGQFRSTIITTTPIPTGTDLYVLIGGYVGGQRENGTFELTIQEM